MAHYGQPYGGGPYNAPPQPTYGGYAPMPPYNPYAMQSASHAQQVAQAAYPVGARVWACLQIEGEVSWGQALILKGLAYMSTALGMGYRIDFQSRPEYGGRAVRDGKMNVRAEQVFPHPPQMY
ncbi:hypothetical protein EXIGLDRAFT_843871 [Exidia glandulosa HHB12029]|uniref:Uncharacterized protein n=1 Tax=Exidia glandulosa HHB12029 TaxID=1314781 RepID=A0A165CDM7_EXIGL|nr:hypothetical protein EXIGLDRAFT_843871 [Exidia glandulosa HHB12029]